MKLMKLEIPAIIFMLSVIFIVPSYSRECVSELPAHLIKVTDSFSANSEVVLGEYIHDGTGQYDNYHKIMVIGAAEWFFTRNSGVYFNGAVKYIPRNKSKIDTGDDPKGKGSGKGNDHVRFSLRDLYLQSSSESYYAKAGFVTVTVNESLLVDERGVGFDAGLMFPKIKFRTFASSVVREFMREGRTCASKNFFEARESEENGNFNSLSRYFWGIQTGITLWGSGTDVNSDDEEFSDVKAETARPFVLNVMYYGEGVDNGRDRHHFFDLHNKYSLATIDYRVEGAVQYYHRDYTVGYIGEMSRRFYLGESFEIKPFIGYTAYNTVQGDTPFEPLFSNMFLGERMQYLTRDDDVIFSGIRVVPVKKVELDFSGFRKISGDKSYELDSEITFYYLKPSKIRIGYAYVSIDDNERKIHMIYGEVRHIF